MLTSKEAARRAKYYMDELAIPPECDGLCLFRPCYNKYENKGIFSQGQGFTSYYSEFYPACATRLNSGCPSWRGRADDKVNVNGALRWVIGALNAKGKGASKRRAVALKILLLLAEIFESVKKYETETNKEVNIGNDDSDTTAHSERKQGD